MPRPHNTIVEATFPTPAERDEFIACIRRILIPDRARTTSLPGLTNYYPNITGIVAIQVHSEGALFVLEDSHGQRA